MAKNQIKFHIRFLKFCKPEYLKPGFDWKNNKIVCFIHILLKDAHKFPSVEKS